MSVQATVLSPIDTQPRYGAGEGGTGAEQISELQTKLLLVVGTLVKVTQSSKLLNADYPLGFAPGQDYAVGVINMKRTGAGEEPPVVRASVTIPFMSTSFKIANSNDIQTSGNAVADFITAYRDGQGLGGYTANTSSPSFYKV